MSFWERNNPLTKYTGKQMIKTLGPVVVKKFQSPKLFLPRWPIVKPTIVNEFLTHQDKLINLYAKLSDDKFDNIVITSPAASLLTIRLQDVQTILVVHEERHLAQMRRIHKQMI